MSQSQGQGSQAVAEVDENDQSVEGLRRRAAAAALNRVRQQSEQEGNQS